MEKFDIAIIGAGPGGYVAAIRGAQEGKKVCVFEKKHIGGVCLNEGCIPTKTLLRSVFSFNEVKKAKKFGVSGVNEDAVHIDLPKLQTLKKDNIRKLSSGVASLLKANGVTVYNEIASLFDKNTILFGDQRIFARNIILASGSFPLVPSIPAEENAPEILTSSDALNLSNIPERIAILGGGAIGVEFAYFFSQIGVNVTIIELLPQILTTVDDEIAALVTKDLEKTGVTILTEAKATKLGQGRVFYSMKGEEGAVEADSLLIAIGRRPCVEGLGLERIGVKMNQGVDTDAFMRTSVPGVYAIGDVNGKSMLAHTASMEGLIAIEHILGGNRRMDYRNIPSCVYIQPEIASVGMTQAQASKKYGNVRVGKFPLLANGKAVVEDEERGVVKVIASEKHGEILGVHIYSPHATDMIAEAALALGLEATTEEMTNTIHPHPTFSEIIPEAFHVLLEKPIHFMGRGKR